MVCHYNGFIMVGGGYYLLSSSLIVLKPPADVCSTTASHTTEAHSPHRLTQKGPTKDVLARWREYILWMLGPLCLCLQPHLFLQAYRE